MAEQVLNYDPALTPTQKEALAWLGLNGANIVTWQHSQIKSSVSSNLTNLEIHF